MIRKLSIFLFLFFSYIYPSIKVTSQEEVVRIERQIIELRNQQEKYQSSATRNSNNAMRWQFQNENYLDARKAWDRVAQDKQKIKEIQEQINDLESHKQRILKEQDG